MSFNETNAGDGRSAKATNNDAFAQFDLYSWLPTNDSQPARQAHRVRETRVASFSEDAQGDLSRDAWSNVELSFKRRTESGSIVESDRAGRITKSTNPDGVVYEYSKFDANNQPTVCKITDTKDGDYGYWKKEEEGLWRSYNKEKPNYEVLKGAWTVDDNGVMHMHGVQDTKELPPVIKHDRAGHITRVDNPNGVTYEYKNFDADGQPEVCKITDRKTGSHGYWKKEDEGVWRAYDGEKPTRQIVRGDWTVDEKGVMHMDGVQDFADIPRRAHRQAQDGHGTTSSIKAGPEGVPHSPPEGYHAFKGKVTPEVAAKAKSLLGGDYGTETPFEIDGRKFMARVEPHYRPEDSKNPGPKGWHKGVTVYEA